jgi:hypothetical protein
MDWPFGKSDASPSSGGLSALVRSHATTMSLPEAMAAIDSGAIARPVDTPTLGGFVAPGELPPRSTPKPPRQIEQDIIDEAKAQAAIDAREMQIRMRAKELQRKPQYDADGYLIRR